MRVPIWDRQAVDEEQVAALAAELGVSPVVARLLWLRGVRDAAAAHRFLHPTLDDLHDPFRLAGMAAAVERLEAALARGETIGLHGDYDVDGITAAVMLRRALELLGGRVLLALPDRLRDGYGLQPAAVERLHAQGASVIVTVDCGVRSAEAAAVARALGVALIVTDHHEPDACLPDALAVINPRRADCGYPDKSLSGAGVALKLVQALCRRAGRERWLPAFVKMAAIGTLADVVPLIGENRVIARLGLEALSRGPHTVGLRALLESAGLAGRRIESFHVGYILAPRVNAAGRMSDPHLAARLLSATHETLAAEARELAGRLEAENARRQEEEARILARAYSAIEADPAIGAHNILIVAGEDWHRGVIGLVAAKLVEAFHKPAVVLGIEGDLAYGSCRSIPAFDMLAALECCHDLLLRFGGHRQAAGLTMETARLPLLRDRLTAYADARLEPLDLVPRLRIDASLGLRGITPDLIEALATLEPFGLGNPRPIFAASPVDIVDGPRLLKDRHLKLAVRQDGRTFRAIAWRAAGRLPDLEARRERLALAFSLERDDYAGDSFVQLAVADLRPAEHVG
ncbi:MAG TPA: single-stranded-DNA-specific exonuclease RecJ [Vicinamibacterales bacterium]|nr:single-stranded-DNA-specific exonuclease RecJ [Vicinamibacterales bacterium]